MEEIKQVKYDDQGKIKITPDKWYELAIILTSADSVMPIFIGDNKDPLAVDKSIALNLAMNILYALMENLSDEYDTSEKFDDNYLFERYCDEVIGLSDYALPLLPQDVQNKLKEDQIELAQELREYFTEGAKIGMARGEGIDPEVADQELKALEEAFNEKISGILGQDNEDE